MHNHSYFQETEGAEYPKVLGAEHPADLMTKYLTREKTDKHMHSMGQEVRDGRAEKGLEM